MMGHTVRNFSYNGFCGRIKGGIAPYTAEFVHWTDDPGVGVFKCSDGKERLIPTFALEDFSVNDLPGQVRTGVLFGAPCQS